MKKTEQALGSESIESFCLAAGLILHLGTVPGWLGRSWQRRAQVIPTELDDMLRCDVERRLSRHQQWQQYVASIDHQGVEALVWLACLRRGLLPGVWLGRSGGHSGHSPGSHMLTRTPRSTTGLSSRLQLL